jgi:hypothetical protein
MQNSRPEDPNFATQGDEHRSKKGPMPKSEKILGRPRGKTKSSEQALLEFLTASRDRCAILPPAVNALAGHVLC